MITLIIPTYNEALHIEKTLRSVETSVVHSGLKVEIIVVDSSVDSATQEAIQTVAPTLQTPLRLIHLSQKTVAGKARNIAVNHAAYDWIATMDAGNTPERTWLETLWTTAKTTGADLVWGQTVYAPKTTFESAYVRSFYRPGFSKRYLNNLLIRKSVYWQFGGLNESVHSGEDLEFFDKLKHHPANEAFCLAKVEYYSFPPSVRAMIRKWTTYTAENVLIGQARKKMIFVGAEVLSLGVVFILMLNHLLLGFTALVTWLVLRWVYQLTAARQPWPKGLELVMTLGLILVFDVTRLAGIMLGFIKKGAKRKIQ